MKFHLRSLHRFLSSPRWVVLIPYAWGLLFCLVPLMIVLKISFSDLKLGMPPYGDLVEWVENGAVLIRLNFSNYLFVCTDSLYMLAYLESLIISGLGTLGCLLIGYPMAYGLSRAHPTLRPFLLMLVALPFWTSFLLRAYAWIGILSSQGLINEALMRTGLITTPLPLLDTHFATVLGITYRYLPFMIFPLYSSLEKIDPSLIEAAYGLGARPFRTFYQVVLPLSRSGIISGSLLVLIPATGEFVIPELLGGSQALMIGKLLWNEFFTNRDWPVACALAIILLGLLVIPLAIFQRFQEREVKFFDA